MTTIQDDLKILSEVKSGRIARQGYYTLIPGPVTIKCKENSKYNRRKNDIEYAKHLKSSGDTDLLLEFCDVIGIDPESV